MSRHKSFLHIDLLNSRLLVLAFIAFSLISPSCHGTDKKETLGREEIYSQLLKGSKLYYQNRYDQAIKTLSLVISNKPGPKILYSALIHRGASLGYLGQTEKALNDFEEALRIDARDPFLYYMRAVTVFAAQKKFKYAIEDLNYALTLHPNPALTLSIYLCRSDYHAQRGEINLAWNDLNQAIRLDPHSRAIHNITNSLGNFYSAKGDILKRKGQYDQALQNYSEAIRLNQQNARAFSGRGFTRILKGDRKGAIPDLQTACRLGHQNSCRVLSMLQK
jgi:tetratricopeptide (TPR) repeat protein